MSTTTDTVGEFTVESEPVETSAVLPARLLVVNCGTAGFDTEIEVEETCNTPSDDIKKYKNKCPNCGKRYNNNNVPRKCSGKITKTVDKWELICDGFAKSLHSVYDEQVPHRLDMPALVTAVVSRSANMPIIRNRCHLSTT